jgi:hypothetical protein
MALEEGRGKGWSQQRRQQKSVGFFWYIVIPDANANSSNPRLIRSSELAQDTPRPNQDFKKYGS